MVGDRADLDGPRVVYTQLDTLLLRYPENRLLHVVNNRDHDHSAVDQVASVQWFLDWAAPQQPALEDCRRIENRRRQTPCPVQQIELRQERMRE
jgi:hypothetical protein